MLLSSNHVTPQILASTSLWVSWPYFSFQLLLHHAVLQELWSALHGNKSIPLTTCPHWLSLTSHLQASQLAMRSKFNRTYSVLTNVQSEITVVFAIHGMDLRWTEDGSQGINDSPSISPYEMSWDAIVTPFFSLSFHAWIPFSFTPVFISITHPRKAIALQFCLSICFLVNPG